MHLRTFIDLLLGNQRKGILCLCDSIKVLIISVSHFLGIQCYAWSIPYLPDTAGHNYGTERSKLAQTLGNRLKY